VTLLLGGLGLLASGYVGGVLGLGGGLRGRLGLGGGPEGLGSGRLATDE